MSVTPKDAGYLRDGRVRHCGCRLARLPPHLRGPFQERLPAILQDSQSLPIGE